MSSAEYSVRSIRCLVVERHGYSSPLSPMGAACARWPGANDEDLDGGGAVNLVEEQAHVLLKRRGDVLAHEVGADGQLPMPTVDEHGELDACGTADVHEGVERRADGAAGEQDVVDEHDGLAVDVEGDLGRVDLGAEIRREIVAVAG